MPHPGLHASSGLDLSAGQRHQLGADRGLCNRCLRRSAASLPSRSCEDQVGASQRQEGTAPLTLQLSQQAGRPLRGDLWLQAQEDVSVSS